MANQGVVSSASGSETIARRGGTSNVPSGSPLDGATPQSNTAVYEGQKVPIVVQTTDLAADNYTEIRFCIAVDDEINEEKNPEGIAVSGTAVHPDSMNKLVQQVSPTESDYGIDIVILGKTDLDATWNVYVTGTGVEPQYFSPNINYKTRGVYIPPLWSYEFLLPGDNTQVTGDNALHIRSYQVQDEARAAVQSPFSARLALQAGSEQTDLTCLHFFGSNGQEIVPTADKQSVWIDSNAQGVLDFSITANTPVSSWNLVTLTMHVGQATVNLPGLIIVDLSQIPKDAQVDPPQIKGATGTFPVDPSGPPIGIIVPSTTLNADRGQIHVDDTLFLAVNGTVLPETGRTVTANDQELIANNQPFFSIAPSLLNYSQSGGNNTILFLIVRPENGAVKSSEFTFIATGDEGDQGTVSPFPTGDQKFPALTILEFKPDHVINADDAENGFTAKIDWSSWKHDYKPVLNQVLTIYCLIAGYDRHSVFQPTIVPIKSHPVTPDDLLNNYLETPISSPSLRGVGVGPNGENSTIIFQFQAGTEYSKPTPPYTINTLAAGGV